MFKVILTCAFGILCSMIQVTKLKHVSRAKTVSANAKTKLYC